MKLSFQVLFWFLITRRMDGASGFKIILFFQFFIFLFIILGYPYIFNRKFMQKKGTRVGDEVAFVKIKRAEVEVPGSCLRLFEPIQMSLPLPWLSSTAFLYPLALHDWGENRKRKPRYCCCALRQTTIPGNSSIPLVFLGKGDDCAYQQSSSVWNFFRQG